VAVDSRRKASAVAEVAVATTVAAVAVVDTTVTVVKVVAVVDITVINSSSTVKKWKSRIVCGTFLLLNYD